MVKIPVKTRVKSEVEAKKRVEELIKQKLYNELTALVYRGVLALSVTLLLMETKFC